MLELLQNTIEYREWGLNAATIGAMGIIFFTFVEGWGLWKQIQTIWHARSGESISFRWFTYLGSYFVAGLVYGMHLSSVSMVFGSLIPALLHLPIILGIMKFKQLGKNEKAQSVLFILMIPAMILTAQKDMLYIVLSIGTIYALATQPLELYRVKSPGVVDIRLITVYLVSTAFWLLYAFAIKAVGLMVVTPFALILLTLTAVLWFRYKHLEAARPAN